MKSKIIFYKIFILIYLLFSKNVSVADDEISLGIALGKGIMENVSGLHTPVTGNPGTNIKGLVFKPAAKIVPSITPIMTNTPYPLTTLKSTALCWWWVKTETIDVGIINPNEVPTAKCIKYAGSIPAAPKM